MKKITYSGVDPGGRETSGFIEADSARAAVGSLKAQGFSEIRLHDDVLTAMRRPDLEGLDDRELAKVAEFEINVREGSGIAAFLLEVARKNWVIVVVGLGLAYWGVIAHATVWTLIGAVLACSMFILSLWNYRVVNRYNRLLRAETLGQSEDALALIGLLRGHMRLPEMAFDLAIREASVLARDGAEDEAFGLLENWREQIEELSPGLFESRMAGVYHASGRYDQVVRLMRTAYEKSASSPTAVIDLALAEARLGDAAAAAKLLDEIVAEEIPQFGAPFVDWVRGVVALRQGDVNAIDYLRDAVSGLLEFRQNPAVWTNLGVCTAYYAVALHAADAGAAARLLESVWPVVKVHGDEGLLDRIAQKMPDFPDPK